ncbi:uncharacterized protein (TIGR02145 family) [Parabacteroides sp. PH5-13]|uniref:FISUMP domain-containing protein n=1 Tax=unclassified Parabacteroides TaxID=2649774 RepID=UPI0024747E6E|nr:MULTISPECIES: FISUMP domain-containing protein [unclassified Parabacteroides]MDH6305573.1 uncharacterized protein (TIGR02145 family) [Parabacteroides sp. PH5-39]MDH6319872.1 uncharacterized protein (TIGR02145 family) [Parabacteroides sp. PH5-13]MDH6323537.1 uncharacterized protein (TIGR02145 family) [Parabacteroides sp. PH5-8]MDH6384649.1 uncharacterized protein (TIGR02145 family) [Parabacteroides sp. PH5-17]MDH6394004.1 uncharacterized protein (TIGR02145 family) [Parabacteroides sp. PFB2-2
MKTKYTKLTMILAALVLMLAPSCSNEEFSNPPIQEKGDGFITFRLQGKRQPVSYATIATANEDAVDSLEIYMFNDRSAESLPNLLQKVFRVSSDDLEQQDTDLKATVDVTGRTGKHTFYFVANGKDNASALGSVNAGATTEEDFLERLSDVQSGLLGTPLLMTARKIINDVEDAKDDDLKVKLLRRVARFDVINDASETNFTIENIIIENVNLQGHAFGDATGIPEPTLAKGTLPLIEYSKEANANTATAIESLFYLYPTEIGADKSIISVEGTFLGERRIYSLKNDQQIEANKRYTLRVQKIEKKEPELNILVDDWADDGGTHEAKPETDDMTVGAVVLTGGAGIQETDKTYDITNATTTGTIKVPVTTFNKSGTHVDVTYLHGTGNGTDRIIVTSPEPTLTYAAGYMQEHKIEIPVQKTPLHARIEIVNNSKPEERDTLYINGVPNYDTTNEKPVLFGDIYWAPVNVGATEIGTTTEVEHHGLLYQWGRSNIGFTYAAGLGTITDTIMGPLDLETATTGEAKDMFIKSTNDSLTDWLTPPDNSLWSGANYQGPCPEGWHIPTKAELMLLITAYGEGYTANEGKVILNDTDKRLEVKGDNGTDMLYFPIAGHRGSYGSSVLQHTQARYWSSEPNPKNANVFILLITPKSLELSAGGRALGRTIRCVQD